MEDAIIILGIGCILSIALMGYVLLFIPGEKPNGFLLTLNNGTVLDCEECNLYSGSCLDDGGIFVCNNKSYSPNVYTEYTKKSERCTDAIIVKCDKEVD